jgi:hypothetical protein
MKAEDILQICLDDVATGRRSPAECARLYSHIPDLEAQLNAVVALRAARNLNLRPQANLRIGARLARRAALLRPAAQTGSRLFHGMRWALAAAMTLAAFLAGASTAAASSNSVPGDLLYGVKRAGEDTQVIFTPYSIRALAYAAMARERLDELSVLTQRGSLDAEILNRLLDDLTAQTAGALDFVDDAPPEKQLDILSKLVRLTDDEQAELSVLKPSAPEAARAGLDRALQASSERHEQAVVLLEQAGTSQTGLSSPTPTSTDVAPSATLLPPSQTHVPPGQTHVPPGQTNVPPGQTNVPPGQTNVPPGQTNVPPGQTNVPPGQTHVPPGQTNVPPGQTHVPPGQTNVPAGQTHVPPGQTNVPPGQTNVPPGQTNVPPGQEKTPGPPTDRPGGPGH